METAHYSEFVGITPDTAAFIEAHRQSPFETKNEILRRLLAPKKKVHKDSLLSRASYLDLGQGAKLKVGENLYLFLSEESKKGNAPDCIAVVRENGLEIEGKLVGPSRGSYIHPAMVQVQKRKRHYNEKGEVISLSAWRQWHVLRDNRLFKLVELKNPELARTRGRKWTELTLNDFDE